ncbi:Uncharacterised protein [Salmonella enterica subsp. enterica serovar Bovismorbificans]|uniref:Uncharacterized protein n=1 Tax=Salmonella enterica subsp. enterica serovar Bovismorbificans TaxID=58097 RepID=A0A655C1Z7_SALET|nr:Uncharacterised protein [Salmonella enterica subsp. enterica serovar Bovismorbificans]
MLPTAHTNATMMENATLSQIPPTLPAMVKNASFVALPSAKRSTLPVANAANATTIINSTVAKTNANSVALLTARPPPSLSSLNVLIASKPRKFSAATEIAVAMSPGVNHCESKKGRKESVI